MKIKRGKENYKKNENFKKTNRLENYFSLRMPSHNIQGKRIVLVMIRRRLTLLVIAFHFSKNFWIKNKSS